MTKFKVDDRVRHRKFGGGVVVSATDADDPGMIPVRFDGWDEYEDATDYHPMRESGIWHDPPADTRKRLREYTDLADGDVVVIAGVVLKIAYGMNGEPTVVCTGSLVPLDHPILGDMLVDEVRRKPRKKKRRVYEEVDAASTEVGDIVTMKVTGGKADEYLVASSEPLRAPHADIARTVYRLVEETDVPR